MGAFFNTLLGGSVAACPIRVDVNASGVRPHQTWLDVGRSGTVLIRKDW